MTEQINLSQEFQTLEQITHDFKTATLYFAVILFICIGSMVIDLILGIIKAKSAGQSIQSYKLRKSIQKLAVGAGSPLLMYCVDLIFIICDLYNVPYLTMLVGGVVTFTELKSWFENLTDKEQARLEHSAKVISHIVAQAGGGASKFGEIATSVIEGDKDSEDESEEKNILSGKDVKALIRK